MIRFVCGTCKEKLAVPERHAGRQGKCPNCGTINRVPRESEYGPPQAAGTIGAVDVARRAGPSRSAPPAPAPARIEAPRPAESPRSSPGFFDRVLARVARKPDADLLDVHDAGGIPRSFKILFVAAILVLIPLVIGAGFVVMILLRVKLGN